MLIVKDYLRRNKVKILKKEEVYELIPKAQAGCKESREKLIIHNIPSVLKIANRYSWAISSVLDFDDLFQHGVLGLMRALKTFDISRGLDLSTYSYPWIMQSIGRYIDNNRGPVRMPIYLQGLKKKYQKLKQQDNPESDELYLRLVANQNEHSVSTLRHAITVSPRGIELDDPEGTLELESIVDENAFDVNLLDAHAMLECLSEQERTILERRLLNWTLRQVAQDINLSRERVRQIEEMAIFKLKAMVGNVKDNNVFELREMLKASHAEHVEQITKKVDSSLMDSKIHGICLDCATHAMSFKENSTKRQLTRPSWINAECDVCFAIKAVTSVKNFEFPVFKVSVPKEEEALA